MELLFLALLVVVMIAALASGFPVAFSLPGSAILTIGVAALCGWVFAGDSSAYFLHGSPLNWLSAGVTNFRGIYWEIERDTLIAIPLFIFMGIMLQRSKIAEDLLVSMAQLFGPIRGGLGISVVFVGGLLAATTGIVGATVVAMGLISLPAMLRNQYSRSMASGTIAASGTLGQIIPPSIVLIILADQLANAVDQAGVARIAAYREATGQPAMPGEFSVVSASAGDMFMGALIPGLVLVGLYMLYILVAAFLRPKLAPAVPYDGNYDRAFALRVFLALIPPLSLIVMVLGSIISGIATVNQAGAIGAVGAMLMAGYRLHEGSALRTFAPAVLALVSLVGILVVASVQPVNIRRVETQADTVALVLSAIFLTGFIVAVAWSGWRTWKNGDTLSYVMIETARTTALVFIILLGAAMLTAAFRAFGGEELVREFLTGLPGGFWVQFAIVMLVIFLMGFFLDFIEIAVVVVPIVAPILLTDPSANVTAIWLGVMVGLNIQTSFLTPPFGFALFYLRGVAPKIVRTVEIYRGVIPFIGLQLFALVIVAMAPLLVNYLPTRISLTSEISPPPRNPRLTACLEDHLAAFARSGAGVALRQQLMQAQALDLSSLPSGHQSKLSKALVDAEEAFVQLDLAVEASRALHAGSEEYRLVYREVRLLERGIKARDQEIEALEQDLVRAGDDTDAGARIRTQIDGARAARAVLADQIPPGWNELRDTFRQRAKEEKKQSLLWRRLADSAYGQVRDLHQLLREADQLEPFGPQIDQLIDQAAAQPEPKGFADGIRAVERVLGPLAGASPITRQLSKARRAIHRRRGEPKWEEGLALLREAREALRAEQAWRAQAAASLREPLATLEEAMRNNLGLRQQDRLPRAVALDIVPCVAQHRDLTVYF